MKIDLVLTACNDNEYYYNMYPDVYKVWKKKFNLDLYVIFIGNEIPSILKDYEKYIILFKPISNINTCYIAQVIRILYPCLFDNKNILTTDMDIIPISYDYFIKSIESYDKTKFITYTERYIDKEMFALCYNVANSTIWKKIFNINGLEDINNFLISNYNNEYNGAKNCQGWYSDQLLLYKYTCNFNDLIILKDNDINFNRLNGKSALAVLNIESNKQTIFENINSYTDFHILRNYYKKKNLLNDIIQKILE